MLSSSRCGARVRWAGTSKTSAPLRKMAECLAGASAVCENSSGGKDFEDEAGSCQSSSQDAKASCDGADAYVNVEVCLGLGGLVVLRHTLTRNVTVGNSQAQLKDVLGEVARQKIGRFVIAQDADASHAGFKNDEKDACIKCFRTAAGRRAHVESIRTGRRVVITAIVDRRAGLLIFANWHSSCCVQTGAPLGG